MLALLQRVHQASVSVDGSVIARIDHGLLIFIGVVKNDTDKDAVSLVNKIEGLRIFEDDKGKMNLSVKDVSGSVLVVSQFTLAANCRKGRRPSFDDAAVPIDAEVLCKFFSAEIENRGIATKVGKFAAHMQVELINDGPVTIWLDSKILSREELQG